MLKRFSSHKFLEFSTLYCQFKRLWSGKSVIVAHERTDFALLVADITGDTWIKNRGEKNENSYFAERSPGKLNSFSSLHFLCKAGTRLLSKFLQMPTIFLNNQDESHKDRTTGVMRSSLLCCRNSHQKDSLITWAGISRTCIWLYLPYYLPESCRFCEN